MKRTLPWQTPARNYYPLPKVLCQLGLSPGEIAVYSFLMYCENRTTYQCYPSYRTIGKAVGMSRNTVAKYVRQLEEKGAHPHGAHHRHAERRPQAKRLSALHDPPAGAGRGAVQPAAAGQSGSRRRASPHTRYAGQTGRRSPAFAPVSHCVTSPERKRVKIAPPGLLSGFGPIFGAPKSGQEKGIGAFPHPCRSRQPAVRAATGVCGILRLTLI